MKVAKTSMRVSPAARHVGARHTPGERNREDAGQGRRDDAQLQRIHQRFDVTRPAIGGEVVREREVCRCLRRRSW